MAFKMHEMPPGVLRWWRSGCTAASWGGSRTWREGPTGVEATSSSMTQTVTCHAAGDQCTRGTSGGTSEHQGSMTPAAHGLAAAESTEPEGNIRSRLVVSTPSRSPPGGVSLQCEHACLANDASRCRTRWPVRYLGRTVTLTHLSVNFKVQLGRFLAQKGR